MTAIRFNPMDYVIRLRNVGFNLVQAEELAKLQSEIISSSEINKSDLYALENKMARMETTLIKWIAGLLLGQMGMIIGLMLGIIKMFV